jgi:hypothetical protein
MIEQETLVTVLGVILLGTSWGLSSSYILSENPTSKLTGSYLPFFMNMIVMAYIAYGLFDSKISVNLKVGILFFFILLSYIELDYMYNKPSTYYGVPGAIVAVTVSTLFRLYFIISMNCNFTKSLFIQVAKSIIEPGKTNPQIVEEIPPDWNKAWTSFEATLKKADLTPDEKLEQINKFRAAWGKPPREVVLKGGKR